MLDRTCLHFLKHDILVESSIHFFKANMNRGLWSASDQNPQHEASSIFWLSEKPQQHSDVFFAIAFV